MGMGRCNSSLFAERRWGYLRVSLPQTHIIIRVPLWEEGRVEATRFRLNCEMKPMLKDSLISRHVVRPSCFVWFRLPWYKFYNHGRQHQKHRPPSTKILHHGSRLHAIQRRIVLHPNPRSNPFQPPPTPCRNPIRQTRHHRRAPQTHPSKIGHSSLLPTPPTQI